MEKPNDEKLSDREKQLAEEKAELQKRVDTLEAQKGSVVELGTRLKNEEAAKIRLEKENLVNALSKDSKRFLHKEDLRKLNVDTLRRIRACFDSDVKDSYYLHFMKRAEDMRRGQDKQLTVGEWDPKTGQWIKGKHIEAGT